MKLSKSYLFLAAILFSATAAFTPIKADSSAKKTLAGQVWLKFDCQTGEPLGGTGENPQSEIASPRSVCQDGDEIRCAVLYSYQNAGMPDADDYPVLLDENNNFIFNHDYLLGTEDPIEAFIEEIKCPEI